MFCVKDNASNNSFRALKLLIFVQKHLKFFDLGLIVSSWANTSVHFWTVSNFPLLIPLVTCPNRPLSETSTKANKTIGRIHHHYHLLTEHLRLPSGVHALITHRAPWHFLLEHIFVILSDFDAYWISHTFAHSILLTVKAKLLSRIWKLEETVLVRCFQISRFWLDRSDAFSYYPIEGRISPFVVLQ